MKTMIVEYIKISSFFFGFFFVQKVSETIIMILRRV